MSKILKKIKILFMSFSCTLTLILALATIAHAGNPGELDSSFDSDGKVTTDLGGRHLANAIAIQSDGRILVAGRSGGDFATNGDFVLARYNVDGKLDTTFHADGWVNTDFSGSND